VQHPAVGQCQVCDEVHRTMHLTHRKVRYRRVDVRMQLQPRWTGPAAFHLNISEVVTDQLGNRLRAVDVRNDFKIDLRLTHILDDGLAAALFAALHIVEQVLVLIPHRRHRHGDAGILEHASEGVVDDGELRVGVLFRKAPDFSSARNRRLIISGSASRMASGSDS